MPKDSSPDLRFTPLVTAAEMFPALERLCLNAREELLMSFRIIDPLTRLRSQEARELGLETWADLLAQVSGRGVRVKLLIADFDPIFTADLHRDAWASARRFGHRLHEEAEVLCALHECRSAPFWNTIFGFKVRKMVRSLDRYSPDQMTPLQHRAQQGDIALHPVTLHQKFAVADGREAIIGGIDVNERRYDDEEHSRRAEDTWHDVSIQISGRIADDLRLHFADCWQRATDACAASFGAAPTPVPESMPLAEVPHSANGPRLLRTLSSNAPRSLRLGPLPNITEHEEAHIAAFESANRLIYIETQFFRHMPLARSLARAARRSPDLQLILVMPSEPERVIFEGHDGLDSRHAQALQLRCLQKLRRSFGPRMAVVSPAQPRQAPKHTPMPLHGAGIVYLHSKVTLVDDLVGIVGSANLNGRSMHWDTEASVQFHDTRDIMALRERLNRTWLRGHCHDIATDRAAEWSRVAEEMASRKPEDRDAFILPYPKERNRRFARTVPILPSDMF